MQPIAFYECFPSNDGLNSVFVSIVFLIRHGSIAAHVVLFEEKKIFTRYFERPDFE